MPNNLKEQFIELFSKEMEMLSFFEGYDENIKSFKFKKSDEEIILNLLWSEIDGKIFPIFRTIGKVRLYKHVYGNGELCHNFVASPLEDETIAIEVSKYVSSIGKYIHSLKREIQGFVSDLPENDLTELENIMAFGYKVADSSSGFVVGDILKASVRLRPRVLFFKKETELSSAQIPLFSREIYIVDSIKDDSLFIKQIKKENNELKVVGELFSVNIFRSSYPFKLNQDKRILLVGLGSLGSFVYQNILNWPRVKALSVNDPDIFVPKNSARNNFGNSQWLSYKANIAKKLFGQYKPNYSDFVIEFNAYNLLIGARTSSSHHTSILKVLQNVDIVIDATGSDAVFKELASLKNEGTIIYKMSLYASGNGMIMGSYIKGDVNKFAGEWNNLRLKKGWDIASAYNGEVPAGFLETSIAANHLTKFIYDTCDSPTSILKEIDNV